MDHTIIPVSWKSFLSTIKTIYPDAIIAGGAIRDTIIGNKVNDVDIFILDDSAIKVNDIADLLAIPIVSKGDLPNLKATDNYLIRAHDLRGMKKALREKAKTPNTGLVDPHYASELTDTSILESHVNLIVDIRYNGEMFQLIFSEQKPLDMVYNDFDFGICKAYFDGTDVVITDDFWYDFENKQLTLAGSFSASQLVHTVFVHLQKLRVKFPGWKVIIDDVTKRPEKPIVAKEPDGVFKSTVTFLDAPLIKPSSIKSSWVNDWEDHSQNTLDDEYSRAMLEAMKYLSTSQKVEILTGKKPEINWLPSSAKIDKLAASWSVDDIDDDDIA